MKKTILSAMFFGMGIIASALEITGEFPIVVTGKAAKNTPEDKAPLVLQEHLSQIFGKKVTVLPSFQWKKGSPAIVLRSNPKLDREEWNIESNGKVLTISGGWPRGVFYGVCEFLEKFGGVRWFTAHEIKIPRQSVLIVPDGKAFRRKPAFPLRRHISSTLEYHDYEKTRAYLKLAAAPWDWPSLFSDRGIGKGHNYWELTSAVPKGMERILPVDKNGNPQRGISPYGPNQVCFSNPEFRGFAKKEIAKWIAREEKFLKSKGLTNDYKAQWIRFSQNDNYDDFCCCEGCRKLYQKYGAVSGAMLEFTNDIAAAFPDYKFLIYAYRMTQNPPENIKARDNVIIQTTFLSHSDLLRPISHPNNETIRKQYDGWRDIAKNKAVYTYHRLYYMTEAFPWPQCCFWNIAENIRYYHKFGAEKLYIESEYWDGKAGFISRAFNDLHNYLECKLMDDPLLDEKPVIEEFFHYQYGPAVNEMKAYAALLKKRIDAVPGIVSEKPIKMRGIMDAEFFKTVNDLFSRAEAKAGNDLGLLLRIAMERIPVDFAAVNMWNQGGSACGISREAVISRLAKNIKLFFSRYQPEKWRKYGGRTYEQWEKETFECLDQMRNPLPIPAGFEKEDVVQIPVCGNCYQSQRMVKDPDAAYGTAVKLGKVNPKYDHAKNPMIFGIYDHSARRSVLKFVIGKNEVPQDEKYHLIFIGRHVPNGMHKEQLWGHCSWELRIADLYKKLWDPLDDKREYDIYISCKMTGPAYVKGSTKENAVYVDKLLAVKRGVREEKSIQFKK